MGSPGLWRDGNYVRFRAARAVSLLGSQVVAIAYPLLVLHLGGSFLEAGLVGTCWLVSRAVFRLPAGQLADRLDRRRIMIGADLLRLANVATIPLAVSLHALTYPQLVLVALVEGAATSAFEPASAALTRDLVPAGSLTRALGQSQGITAVTALVGPPLGGLCFTLNSVLPFIADGVSYALSAVLLLAVRASARQPGDTAAAPAADRAPTDRRATAGLRWIWARPAIRWVLAFAAVLNVVGAAAQMAVVVILQRRGTAPDLIGIVLACIGAGTIAGALLARHIVERLDPPRLCLAVGAVWVGGFATFALVSSPWVFGPALALIFFLSPASGITLSTITLSQAPHDMLGRIVTAEQLTTNTLVTVGPLLAGIMLQALGASWMWLLLAGACAPVTVLAGRPLLSRGRAAAPQAPAAEAAAPLPRR